MNNRKTIKKVCNIVVGVISSVIMNMALDGLEAVVHASIGTTKSALKRAKIHAIRYCDDFVVTGTSKEVLELKVLPAIRKFMAARGLELSEEKTSITHIAQGFDFLGQNLRKYYGKLLIKPAKRNVKTFLNKVRKIIKDNASATQEILIHKLNPVIRGWAMYHRHVVAKACFSSIDAHIWRLLWKWAKRRHPNKGARWVKKKYFQVNGLRSWDFATRGSSDGDTTGGRLLRAMTIPITRHVKVRGPANPFDPTWDIYFTHRHAAKRSVEGLGTTPGAEEWLEPYAA